jgi:hypothetical protein
LTVEDAAGGVDQAADETGVLSVVWMGCGFAEGDEEEQGIHGVVVVEHLFFRWCGSVVVVNGTGMAKGVPVPLGFYRMGIEGALAKNLWDLADVGAGGVAWIARRIWGMRWNCALDA